MAIEQTTADARAADSSLQRFAEAHGMFYSLDWGRLLLPQHGQLFSTATFTRSDVNNHVIGMWGDQIVQLYTYSPLRVTNESYLIAQIALPKSYDGIIIKRSNGWRSWGWTAPRGYQAISMEWPDFNKCYKVYATDIDQVTSFELLNPKFMADLYDKALSFSRDVIDNVVDLYARLGMGETMAAQQRYDVALEVLQAAYEELYM
jgi:hypothetical protein